MVLARLVPGDRRLTLSYAVLTIGLARTPYVARTARFGDFSYGLYLYAFPVQQLVIDEWGVRGTTVNFLVVLAITSVFAVLSWHLVERPALALKDRDPAPAGATRHPGGGPRPVPVTTP